MSSRPLKLYVKWGMAVFLILVVGTVISACQPATPTPSSPSSPAPTPIPTVILPSPTPTVSMPGPQAFSALPEELCDQVQQAVEHALGTKATGHVTTFVDPVSGEKGTAYAIKIEGTGQEFSSPMSVVERLAPVFAQMGWKEISAYQASAPTGEATAYQNGNQFAYLLAQWTPAEDAHCPEDKPISQCDLKPEQKIYTITVHLLQRQPVANLPNPASVYCEEHGGKVEIRKDPQGNEYGVCVFPDGSECEEWSFYRGECQPGQQTSTPKRITFAPGATSTNVEGVVPPRGEVDFVLNAQKGQVLILDLSSGAEDLFLGVVTDDGCPLVRPVAEARHWMGELPKSGDYYVEVAAMREGGPFSLLVQIPQWITFAPDKQSVTLKGVVQSGQMVDYLIKATKGQHLRITVQSPNQSALLNIVALENGMPILRYVAESVEFDDVLPYDDLYLISVFGGAPEAVKYTLTVSITKVQAGFKDPFAYCKAVGTVDTPDDRYTGEKVPAAIITAIREAAGIAKDAPDSWVAQGTVWRCMDGQVWGCFIGANIPCTAKADTSQNPTEEMISYCKEHPDAELIPASVAGRTTVYEWRCKGQIPEVHKQILHPDKQGFISEFWYPLPPPNPSEQ